MTEEVPAHIQRHRVGRASAALPEWAAVKFTDAQAAAMRPVGIEMLNKRGVCALHLKIIADAAGVSVGTARDALNIADTIGLIGRGVFRKAVPCRWEVVRRRVDDRGLEGRSAVTCVW